MGSARGSSPSRKKCGRSVARESQQCSFHVGGAEIAAWEALLELEKFDLKAGQKTKKEGSRTAAFAGSIWKKCN